MADFDRAAERLSQRNNTNSRRGGGGSVLSAKASREAARQKALQQQRALERAKKQQQEDYLHRYLQECESHFGIEPLVRGGSSLQLQPTSIHGEGDKIALPPSVLEFLTQQQETTNQSSSPWTFRIGIRNPKYQFPAAERLKQLSEDGDDDHDDSYQPFVEELHQQYLAYTHGTVVEFTQEEGYVGLPAPIAQALLSSSSVSVTRTVDPSKTTDTENDDTEMATATTTPGHIAWGAFDLPDTLIEITLIRHVPKGTSARLRPSQDAVRNGFYRLQDIKLVLEQSLMRTRATLSIDDTLFTWHRGKQFELQVVHVEPSEYGSVSCINTDIEIEFEEQTMENDTTTITDDTAVVPSGNVLGGGGGRRLDSSTPSAPPIASSTPPPTIPCSLPAEPPANSPDCITLQLRSPDGTKRQRRFLVDTATVDDLWTWAAVVQHNFQLVTRFPRRVWTRQTNNTTLRQAGLQPGQEVLWLEENCTNLG